MGGYVVVLVTVVVCSAATSTCQNDSEEFCQLKGEGSSNLSNGETKQGDVLQWKYIECMLISQDSGVKFTFDINWALDTAAEVESNTLVGASVTFSCPSSIELDFINYLGDAGEKKNIFHFILSKLIVNCSFTHITLFLSLNGWIINVAKGSSTLDTLKMTGFRKYQRKYQSWKKGSPPSLGKLLFYSGLKEPFTTLWANFEHRPGRWISYF